MLGHDFDLSGSVTSLDTWPFDSPSFPIGGPLDPSLYLYRIILPQTSSARDTMLNRHCACAISH